MQLRWLQMEQRTQSLANFLNQQKAAAERLVTAPEELGATLGGGMKCAIRRPYSLLYISD